MSQLLLNQAQDLTQEIKAKLVTLEALLEKVVKVEPVVQVVPADQEEVPALPPVAWGKKVSKVFKQRILWIQDTLGVKADWLMACIAFETGQTFSPKVKNPASSATGLIQFMEKTAIALGTTTAQLSTLSAENQLQYVFHYFEPWKGKLNSIEDTYMAILYPKAIGEPLTYKMFSEGDRNYLANKGLDINRDGSVTKAEAAAKVVAMLIKGLEEGNVG